MALTPSTMMPLGTQAPDFALPDTEGNTVTRDSVMGEKGLLVMFICNHCPFVKHVAQELKRIGDEYPPKGIGVVAVCANDQATHPDDSPEKMKEEKESRGYRFPYLHDATQEVAKAYRAACTPDFLLFDGQGQLVYRGQLDDSRPESGVPVTGDDLRNAMNALLRGEAVPGEQKPSMGCNIKWKSGAEPAYASS
jgi:peroxiredoxin